MYCGPKRGIVDQQWRSCFQKEKIVYSILTYWHLRIPCPGDKFGNCHKHHQYTLVRVVGKVTGHAISISWNIHCDLTSVMPTIPIVFIQTHLGSKNHSEGYIPSHLTHCGQVTQYNDIDLGQHWHRLWLVSSRHQAITSSNFDLSVAITQEQFHREFSWT